MGVFYFVRISKGLKMTKFRCRVPEMLVKINNFIVFNFYAFAFQKLLHNIGSAKMMFSCKHPVSVYNPVCRNILQRFM